MSLVEEQRSFYCERVPEQFNRTLARQESLAATDEDAARILVEMRAVRASIRIEVEASDETFVHLLEIDDGVMHAVETVSRPTFLILHHRLAHFPNLSRRCGTSVLGFLGSMAGLSDEMLLTSQRVRSLRDLRGGLLFEVGGEDGFSLVAGFGVDSNEDDPGTAIRLTPEIFDALQSGDLDAQDAFFDEKIAVEGNMEIAIGAALAALSQD